MYHIDWLTITQEGVQNLPDWGERGMLIYDLETGEHVADAVTPGAYEGSYSTRATVKAHGGRLVWSGNPARIDRLDNLFGFDLEQSVFRVNSSLESLGLPGFTRTVFSDQHSRSDSVLHQGARLSRIDITRNIATGSPDAVGSWLWSAHGARIQGRPAQPSATGASWGRRQYRQLVTYDKGAELRRHLRSRVGLTDDELDYRSRLASWCSDQGVLRVEVRLGGEYLRQTSTSALGMLTHTDLEKIAEEYWQKLRVGSTCDMSDVFIMALEEGFSPRRAAQLRDVHGVWLLGSDIRGGRSIATLYRLRSDIARVAGVDIFTRPNVTALTKVRREIVLSPVSPPSWYRWGTSRSAA